MIQENELARLLIEGETDRIERTTSANDTDKFCEAVTACANDLPNHRAGLPRHRGEGRWDAQRIESYPQSNLTSMFLDEDRLEKLWPDGKHPNTMTG